MPKCDFNKVASNFIEINKVANNLWVAASGCLAVINAIASSEARNC